MQSNGKFKNGDKKVLLFLLVITVAFIIFIMFALETLNK